MPLIWWVGMGWGGGGGVEAYFIFNRKGTSNTDPEGTEPSVCIQYTGVGLIEVMIMTAFLGIH